MMITHKLMSCCFSSSLEQILISEHSTTSSSATMDSVTWSSPAATTLLLGRVLMYTSGLPELTTLTWIIPTSLVRL
jgi:hypothetical protein